MNLGVVTPQLVNYGGSEIYLLECVKRWQRELDITLYACSINKQLLAEFGVSRTVRQVVLPSKLAGRTQHGLLEESLILPHIWERNLQQHDLYFLYLFPTQMIRRRPSVWFAAEPLRMLYDLRHTVYSPEDKTAVHFYPKLNYDVINTGQLDILLELIERIDSSPECDRWATNSRLMSTYLENVYGRKPDLVVYPGVAVPPQITPLPPVNRAISVGRLWKHKRVDLAMKAFSMIPDGELLIVGDGPEKRLLQRLRKELGLGKKVRFVGTVSKQRLAKLFEQSTCCVYTSVMEPFGMVPLEAAAAGRPVVGTIGCGYSEILKDPAARLVPAVPEKIAEAVQTFFSDRELARQAGEAGRNAVRTHSWDTAAESLLQLFRETTIRSRASQRVRRRVQLGAHYYPWYRTGDAPEHWNENQEFASVTDLPAGGSYNSTNLALIRRHLKTASEAGLDFFVVNLQLTFQGIGETEMNATRRLFRVVEEQGSRFKLAILISAGTEDARVIGNAIQAVRDEFTTSPCYQKWNGRPLIWYYLSGPFLGYFFFRYQELIRLNRGVYPVATGAMIYNKFLPRLLQQFFKGWCLYSPLEIATAEARSVLWTKGYRDYHENGGEVRIFTVCPGYDDSRVRSYDRMHNPHRVIPRYGLGTYQEMQECALRLTPAPDMVVITSFNEFHENTHIEPSERFGDLYINSTRAFSQKLKKLR